MNYVTERIDHPDQPEIKFFDESIVEKQNRSKLALTKLVTPFLADERDSLQETFTVPGPSISGIPHDQTFTYTAFPNLDPLKFGPIRPTVPLVDSIEMKRIGLSAALADVRAATMNATFGEQRLANSSTITDGAAGSEGWRDSLLLPASDSAGSDVEGQLGALAGSAVEEKQLNLVFLSARTHFLQTMEALTIFQSICRMKPVRERYCSKLASYLQMTRLVVQLQSFVRRNRHRRRYVLMKWVVAKLQVLFRLNRLRRIHFRVSRLQALIRGVHTRLVEAERRMQIFTSRRFQALQLWAVERTSLGHRSRMWVLVDKCSLLHLGLYEEELLRLYQSLGLTDRNSQNYLFKNGAQVEHSFEGIFAVVQIFCRRVTNAANPLSPLAGGIASHMSFPATAHSVSSGYSALTTSAGRPTSYAPQSTSDFFILSYVDKESKDREEEERRELYTILKSQAGTVNDGMFRDFGLVVTKKRKQVLSNTVWTVPGLCSSSAFEHATLSATVVIKLLASKCIASNTTVQHSKSVLNSNIAMRNDMSQSKYLGMNDFTETGNKNWLQNQCDRRVAADAMATVRACLKSIQMLQRKSTRGKRGVC